MKKQLLAALLALSLLLTGCASLLEREYSHAAPHNAIPTAEGDPSTLRAESYQELVNALLHLVTGGAETGRIRLYLDADDLDSVLDTACLEVVQEDPLGAYAVEYIKYSVQPVVTYADADVEIVYRRTQEQVAAISSVTGITAIRNELQDALTAQNTELVLRISYFDGDESFIRSLCLQAFYADPTAALDLPDITLSIYPDSGRQRIVEMTMAYHLLPEEWTRRRQTLETRLEEFTQDLFVDWNGVTLPTLIPALLDICQYDPEGGSTAYHALAEGSSDSQGLALALSALCQKLDIPCRVVPGTKDGVSHTWNMVLADENWYHLDLTLDHEGDSASFSLHTDAELSQSGYVWDTQFFPSSTGVPAQSAPAPALS